MRTPTEAQAAALAAPTGSVSYHRVRVLVAGAWRDLSTLAGRDFQVGGQWSLEQDTTSGTATVSFLRESADISVAPLVTDSVLNALGGEYEPLLGEGVSFIIEAAVVPSGTLRGDVGDGEWMPVFEGVIDDTNATQQAQLTARDLGGRLLDAVIEEPRKYGSTTGVPVEEVMGSILEDNGFDASELRVIGDTDWALGPYELKPTNVMQALQDLAAQMGWDLRYRWSEADDAWKLTLSEPDRAAAAAHFTYKPGAYEVTRCVSSLVDVRNRILLTYERKDAKDAEGKPLRPTVVREDLDSQAKYGVRTFMITEASASNIDTPAEAERFADAALADLKNLSLEIEVKVDFNPFVEIGDMVALVGPHPSFTEDQLLAVINASHTFGTYGGSTVLTLRGKPSVARSFWRRVDVSYHAPTSPAIGPLAPTGLEVVPTINGFCLSFYPPVQGPKPEVYELHLSATPSFNPDTSSASTTFYAASKTDTFNVTDLPPGVTRYARVVPKTAKNSYGDPSTEVSLTTQYVQPRFLQPRVTYAALPLNSDFEAQNDPAAPPDNWSMVTGTWGTDAAMSSDSYTGAYALMLSTPLAAVRAQPVSVRPGVRYAADVITKSPSSVAGEVLLEWYDASLTLVSTTNLNIQALGVPTSYARRVGVASAPAGARFASVVVRRANTLPNSAVYFDSVTLLASDAVQEAAKVLPVTGFWSTPSGKATAMYWRDATGSTVLSGAVTGGANGTLLATLPSGYAPSSPCDFPVATSSGVGVLSVTATGTMAFLSGATGATFIALDGVRIPAP